MKRFSNSLAAKVTASVVFLLCGVMIFVCSAGISTLVQKSAYTIDEETYVQNDLRRVVQDHVYQVLWDQLYDTFSTTAPEELNVTIPELVRKEFGSDTNLRFAITDRTGSFYATNDTTDASWTPLVRSTDTLSYRYPTATTRYNFKNVEELDAFAMRTEQRNETSSTSLCEWEHTPLANGSYEVTATYYKLGTHELEITAGVLDDFAVSDQYSDAAHQSELLYSLRYAVIVGLVFAIALAIASLVAAICGAGRKNDVEGVYLCWLNKIPFDLLVLAVALPLAIFSGSLYDTFSTLSYLTAAWGLLYLLIMSFAARAKAGKWWENTLCYRLPNVLRRLAQPIRRGLAALSRHLPLAVKIGLLLAGVILFNFVLAASMATSAPLLWAVQTILLIPLAVVIFYNLYVLKKGSEAIAEGDLQHQISLKHLLPGFKGHGDSLNHISIGMQRAVEERLKSERMKTELITNVSHDIKTPLTSIINYIDLLKRPDNTPEETRQYLDVLERQSVRLKRLTEDVIEASKASTGAIAMNLEPTNLNVLLLQATGEYTERLQDCGLELVYSISRENPMIMADGKLLWRVFDNLLGNVKKYALAGTRVYIASRVSGQTATISFRNISREQLNITSDELFERFVRGDASRNTEGNGLGLSIARSLTELQQGTMDIQIDGDLFKVVLQFPILAEKAEGN